MAWTPTTGAPVQYQKSDGTLASDYYIKFYQSGTTTAFSMATDSTGGTTLDKAKINSSGYPVNGSDAVFIPHVNQTYKIVLYKNSTDADNDTTANADWVVDNIEPVQTGTNNLWNLFSGAPTQTSSTTFTIVGDQRSTFTPGTRLKLTDSSTLYAIVETSSYTTLTTVTVELDSGNLSGSLTEVYTSQAGTTSKPISTHSITYNSLETSSVNRSLYSVLSEVFSVLDFGADPTGGNDSTSSINSAWTAASATGGVLYIPPGNYKITSLNFSDANTTKVLVRGYGAELERSSTTSNYTMLTHRGYVVFEGLTLKGYIDSGTGFADAVPTTGFGFRPDSSTAAYRDCVYRDCLAYNLTNDGWYIDASDCRIFLENCSGYDCLRNDFAFTHGQSVVISGGEWGNDTSVWVKNAAMDIEPNSGDECHYALVKNARIFHKLAYYGAAGAGLIEHGECDDIVFDGAVYGTTCGLRWYRVDEMVIGKIVEENSATLQQANFPGANAQARGGFYFKSKKPFNNYITSKNLLVNPYNSLTGWTASIGGGTTATPNVDCHGFKGIRLDNAATSFISYRQDVTVSVGSDTRYTFGGLIELIDAIGGNTQGIRIQIDGGDSYWLMGEGNVSGSFIAPAGTTTITFWFGTNSSLNLDAVFSKMFLCEGFVPPPDVEEVAYWSAAPTTGTWSLGDKVFNSSPSTDGNGMVLDHWICTSAGTPGTWVPQYISTVSPAT